MCLTTTSYYLHPPTMIPEHPHYSNSRPASHLDILLETCDVSSSSSASPLFASNSNLGSAKDAMNDSTSSAGELDLNDVLMSSISLDESASFIDLEEEPKIEYVAPYTTLFDHQKKQYEWNDDFSMLLKLKTTRLLTIHEGEEES